MDYQVSSVLILIYLLRANGSGQTAVLDEQRQIPMTSLSWVREQLNRGEEYECTPIGVE